MKNDAERVAQHHGLKPEHTRLNREEIEQVAYTEFDQR